MSDNIIDKKDKELRSFITSCLSDISKTIEYLEAEKEKRYFLIQEIKAGLYDTKRI